MRHPLRRPRRRYPSRRWAIPFTALLLAAATLALHQAGASAPLEQGLFRMGLRLSAWLSARQPPPDLPASDSPTLFFPGLDPEDLWESPPPATPAPDNSADSPSSGPAAQTVTLTGGGNSYDPSRVYIKDLSGLSVDPAALLRAKHPVTVDKSDPSLPQILIVHTHGTEAYTPQGSDTYKASGSYRTLDSKQNMLRVGEEITRVLNSRGIGTVHSTALHDYPSYNGAYTRALTDIKSWLKKYPSIKLVIDVHRDALMEGSTVYKTMAQIQGDPCAQLMLVAGTDGGNLSHPNWKQNAAFQVQLHHALNTAYPSIMRPMSFRAGRYNQHMTSGSRLVEVGTCGHSLQEALTAGRLFANTLADLLLNG